ncbi:MAG: hypothetical protein AAB587_01035 [Patescibacteria group bacterium]
MAKQRIVNTRFWDDSYIVSLTPIEKLLFLYLLTNPLTNISGVYEIQLRRISFDTGVAEREAGKVLERFEARGKIIYSNGWVGIRNWIKNQTLNPKVKQGITLELKKAPRELIDRLSIDYPSLSIPDDRLSYPNLNSNTNSNPKFNVPLERVFGNVKRIA